MTIKASLISSMAIAVVAIGSSLTPSAAENAGVKVGQLTCEVAGGAGFIFGSSKDLTCTFTPASGPQLQETYTGVINKFGVDIGVTGKAVILWTVVAAQKDIYEPGVLAGSYAGASASAAFVAGLGANVLVGGLDKSFALQPVSVSAESGVNVAVGLSQLKLTAVE